MIRHSIKILHLSLSLAAWLCLAQTAIAQVARAQPARVQRAIGAEDLVRFSLENYFRQIALDERRREKVREVVREHFEASKRMKTIEEKNAALPRRREKLRALLRSDAERKQFDRNVTERALP